MNFHIENLGAIDRLQARFRKLQNPDAEPLMLRWMDVIRQDNQRGVMAGLDKDGHPLQPVTYRPLSKLHPAKPTVDQRSGRKASQKGVFGGFGPMASGLHNNLTPGEYRQLGGPPLAPRGKYSRTITNLKTEWRRTASGSWEAYGYWDEVVSVKGVKFLKYHFHGIGQKRRDLTGVRPAGVELARKAGRNWMIDIVRSSGA